MAFVNKLQVSVTDSKESLCEFCMFNYVVHLLQFRARRGRPLCAAAQRSSVAGIANVVPSSPILVTLMMDAMRSSETSVLTRATQHNISEDGILHEEWFLTRATRRNIPEDGILHSHRPEVLNCYTSGRVIVDTVYIHMAFFSADAYS
jgi:hypothetical protein